MGLRIPETPGQAAATIIPSVGCPMGCNFCTTSAFFGGKGKFLNFYETGEELFDMMCEMESSMKRRSFFIMDENFLLYQKRAMELLDRMKATGKAWALYVFSSANAIRKYTMKELVELGISWIWMGLESPQSTYAKLQDTDTLALTQELRANGIKLLGSTIVGLEHHTPDNIRAEIEHAVSHETDFHQFMLYTPVPGTPLYQEMEEQDRMVSGVDLADIHGQDKFNFQHAAISREQSKQFLDFAFRRDFERNGPSLYPRLAHDAGRMEALQEPSRSARPRTIRMGSADSEECGQRPALGHGAPIAEDQCRRKRPGPRAPPGIGTGVWPRVPDRRGTRAGDPVGEQARRAAPRQGQNLRTGYGGRTAELVGGLGAGLRRGRRTGPLRQEWDPSTDP